MMSIIKEYSSNKKLLLKISLITLVHLWLPALYIIIAGASLSISINYWTAFTIHWISYLLGRISILPAGLGIYDVTMGGLLISFGFSPTMAINIVLVYRILSMLPQILIGGGLFVYWGNKLTFRKLIRRDSPIEVRDSK